ncbi:MAG: hypothetical protein AAF573_02925 [Bacteroidota bacterium]
MRNTVLILVFIHVLSCQQNKIDPYKNQEIKQEEVIQVTPDTSITNYYAKLNFQRDDGRFLKYFCEGDNLFIKYGNNDFEKIFKDTFLCEMPYVRIPMLWADDEKRILLRFGCGSPCWGLYELPLNQKDTIEQYMYHYDYDTENNILIHISYHDPKDEYVLMARNLSTKEYEIIEIENCDTFLCYCIDSISFNNRELYVRSRTKEEMKEGFDRKGSNIFEKRIRI